MAAVPLLRTKLFIPPLRAEWVARPRLTQRLVETARHPLTLISAPSPPLIEPLTERELELLRLVAAGYSNKQIAQELFLAVGTVKKHLNNIFGKLEVGSRTQAIIRAQELDLL